MMVPTKDLATELVELAVDLRRAADRLIASAERVEKIDQDENEEPLDDGRADEPDRRPPD